MNQRSTPSTRTTIGHLVLAGLAITLAGCQSCLPGRRSKTITPAAYDSIVNNAGYRETTWTPLDPCDAWQSPVRHEHVDQQWFEHVGAETLPNPIEQISHEVPSELANVDLANIDLAAVDPQLESGPADEPTDSVAQSSTAPDSESIGTASASVATGKWYEIESGPSEELEHVEIEYLR
ncbi:hypothetical protein NZK35_09970 [Stieleria sp. ICT_E10.1]|uniref:hypothetical protein n=1 Tax=Stieleria sedimenti TaxID=2976331 RepID=UPI00217F2670|nr:hypothetical protein [Stieleria sedimenti]MCS7466971.1 hypothetical protein [Stieleria sedimenti]